jgi:large subunit ribosomal protein L3
MQSLLGKKLGMTKIYKEDGTMVPVTVIKAGPCKVVNLITKEKNGYDAVQIGFEDVDDKKLNKPELGVYKKNKISAHKYLREIRLIEKEDLNVGQDILVDIFKEGEKVDVSGKTIGKGYSGAMKRHKFRGAKDSHGCSKVHRRPCSAGATDAARTIKGKRSPGHMGNRNYTSLSLEVVKIDKDRNLILVKGAVPGHKGTLVTVRKTVRVKQKRKNKVRGNR